MNSCNTLCEVRLIVPILQMRNLASSPGARDLQVPLTKIQDLQIDAHIPQLFPAVSSASEVARKTGRIPLGLLGSRSVPGAVTVPSHVIFSLLSQQARLPVLCAGCSALPCG